jgi:hypothetical protein
MLPRWKRRRELKLQKLLMNPPLDRANQGREARAAPTALDEEPRAACMLAHELPNPLAIEAGLKWGRRWGSHRRWPAGTTQMRWQGKTPSASRSGSHPSPSATPLTTKAGRRAERGITRARGQWAEKTLFKGVAATPSTFSSDQRSQSAATVSPNTQISSGSGAPCPGREPDLWHVDQNIQLQTIEGPVPLLHLPPPVAPARSVSDRPSDLSGALKL